MSSSRNETSRLRVAQRRKPTSPRIDLTMPCSFDAPASLIAASSAASRIARFVRSTLIAVARRRPLAMSTLMENST